MGPGLLGQEATIQGVPWDPVPGRNGNEVKSFFRYRDDREIIHAPSTREAVARRIYIRSRDIGETNMD